MNDEIQAHPVPIFPESHSGKLWGVCKEKNDINAGPGNLIFRHLFLYLRQINRRTVS